MKIIEGSSFESPNQPVGKEVRWLREIKGMKRPQVVERLYHELWQYDIEGDVLNYDPATAKWLDDLKEGRVTEDWLRRLERGDVVKVTRPVIEALCRALDCTPQEYARVLLLADRSVLNSAQECPTEVDEMINLAMYRLRCEAYEILATLFAQRKAQELDKYELFEIIAKVLAMILDEYQDG